MRPKGLAKLCAAIVRNPLETFVALSPATSRNELELNESIALAADWLLMAQRRAPDGRGYSRRYSLIRGWDRCYVETTGYIIPTLLDVSRRLQRPEYRASALDAGSWLLGIQTEEGSFTDIDRHEPQVFDTGQVLLGINRIFRETGDERFLDAIRRAATWLTNGQEADGAWIRCAYLNRPHAYYSRVGAALIEAGQVLQVPEYIAAGLRNLRWVASQRSSNGYFKNSEFRPGEDPLLHTLVYVLEGFTLAYDLTGDPQWARMVTDGVGTLTGLADKKGALHSQYDSSWRATNSEYCVTGLAQYAGACFDAARFSGEQRFITAGTVVIELLRGLQQREGANLAGALQSSVPLWGYYGGMEFYNWNVKFFLDALLKQDAASRAEEPSSLHAR